MDDNSFAKFVNILPDKGIERQKFTLKSIKNSSFLVLMSVQPVGVLWIRSLIVLYVIDTFVDKRIFPRREDMKKLLDHKYVKKHDDTHVFITQKGRDRAEKEILLYISKYNAFIAKYLEHKF